MYTIVPVQGSRELDKKNVIMDIQRATVSILDDAAVDSDTNFYNLGATLMDGGKAYGLGYLTVRLRGSEDYDDGTTPTAGLRHLYIMVGMPGVTPSSTDAYRQIKVPVVIVANTAPAFPNANGANSYEKEINIAIVGSLKRANFTKDAPLNVRLYDSTASGAGQDSADDVGGIEMEVEYSLIAKK